MGMDLQKLSKEWTSKGFEGIPKYHLKRIEEAYILQENFQKQREYKTKGGKQPVGSIKPNLKANNRITKGQPKRRG